MSIAIMSKVWGTTPVRDGREIVGLLALADWADDYGGAYPAYDVLAHKMRCSERQAMRVIANLSDAGEVYRLPEKARRKAFFNSNLFVVLSGCESEADIAERIYKSAKGKGVRLKKTDIPSTELHQKRVEYLAKNPLAPSPRGDEGDTHDTPLYKGGDAHDTPTGDTHDTHDLSPMSPNTSLIRHTDTSLKDNGGGNASSANNDPAPTPFHPAAAVSDDSDFISINAAITAFSNTLTDPFTGIPDLTRQLQRQQKTATDVSDAIEKCQIAVNPPGAFLYWVRTGVLPAIRTKSVPKPLPNPSPYAAMTDAERQAYIAACEPMEDDEHEYD
jgi:hypothetical protein